MGNGDAKVRVLLSTHDSRGGIEPLLGLAAGLRALGAEVRMCAPPDCAGRLAEVGVPGRSVPPEVTDPRALNDLDIQNYNAVYGPALNTHRVANGLPPVDNVRDYVIGDHPWLAADPILAPWPEPAQCASTELRWPRGCWPTPSAGKGRRCPREPPVLALPGPRP
jgi:UDP:flavonoid glycosyltransferase YjiC (YdhE family)